MGIAITKIFEHSQNDDDSVTGFIISYKPVRKLGISKDNLQRLQAQHPDIYEQYVTVSESRRFYVKKQREEAA